MRSYTLLPLVDLIFLAFGGALCCMTQMEVVRALPVEVTEVGAGASVIKHGAFAIVSLTRDGLHLDGKPVTRQSLIQEAAGKQFVLRVDEELPTKETIQIIGDLVFAGAELSLEVRNRRQ
jgi:hypothetical protein